jgi:hypothetical protein
MREEEKAPEEAGQRNGTVGAKRRRGERAIEKTRSGGGASFDGPFDRLRVQLRMSGRRGYGGATRHAVKAELAALARSPNSR